MVMTYSDVVRLGFRQESDIVVDDEDVSLELNPQLWQNLPQDLLERVLSKLPVSRLAVFRRVCKLWNLDIVPHAATHQIGECGERTVLYFDFQGDVLRDEAARCYPWWMEVCETRNHEESKNHPWRVQEFRSKSFPLPSDEEEIRLWICERGLLFFGLMAQAHQRHCRRRMVLRDIVVCNPLTSQSKVLALPCALLPPSKLLEFLPGAEVLMGTVFDSQSGKYRLVAAGVDGTGKFLTFVYDSLKSAWTNVLSVLPTLLEVGDGDDEIDLHTWCSRSVCFNGNLYWLVQASVKNFVSGARRSKGFVLKFDLQYDTWRPFRIPGSVCCDMSRSYQMILGKSGVLILHLHANAIRDPPFDSDPELELAPEIKLVQCYTIDVVAVSPYFTAVVEASRNGKESLASWQHTAFSHDGNLVYHVLLNILNDGLRIIVQKTEDNSFEDLGVLRQGHKTAGRYTYYFASRKYWSFSPSLKWVP